MPTHHTWGWLTISATVVLSSACSSDEAAAPPDAGGGSSGTHQPWTPGEGGTGNDSATGGTLVGAGAAGGDDALGDGGSKEGSGATEGSGGADGSGGSGIDEGGSTSVGGSTIDVGSGGVGSTIDVSGGVGGTIDLGSGGTVDLGMGGTVDLGTGGTVDLGTGGTFDTPCVPECIPDEFGAFGELGVNVIVFKDATAGGCDTEGRMWVGGDANLSGYGVGNQLSSCDDENYVLVVGGSLSVQGGINGKVWVGGEFIDGSPACGGVDSQQPAPVDFPALEAHLEGFSDRIATYAVNGTTTFDGTGAIAFDGADPDMNVFEVSGEDLTAATGVRIDAPLGSTVIVNVTGTSVGFINGTHVLPDNVTCGSGAVSVGNFCNQVIYNMPNVETLTVTGTSVQGSILAPRATFTGGGAQVNGQVIIDTYDLSGCVEAHPHYFTGCLCLEGSSGPEACCP